MVPPTPPQGLVDVPVDNEHRQVFIDVTCVLAGENFFANLGGGGRLLRLDATATEVILRAIQKSERVNIVQAPRLLAFVDQQASIFIGETIGTDKVLTGAADWSFLRAHVAGFHLTATPSILDSGRVKIDSHLFLRQPGTDEAPLSGPVYETAAQLDLGPGESMLIRTAAEPAGTKELVTFVTARVLAPTSGKIWADPPATK